MRSGHCSHNNDGLVNSSHEPWQNTASSSSTTRRIWRLRGRLGSSIKVYLIINIYRHNIAEIAGSVTIVAAQTTRGQKIF